MRVILAFLFIATCYSCQDMEESNSYTYSGHVFSYSENEGEELSMTENIFSEGSPINGVQLKLIASPCSWNGRCGTLCSPLTNELGYFECELDDSVYEHEIDHDSFANSKFIDMNEDKPFILLFNTTKVGITIIDTSNLIAEGAYFRSRALHRSHAYKGANFDTSSSFDYVNGNRVYTDSFRLMENVNMRLSYQLDKGAYSELRFFTGDKNDPRTVTVYL